MALGAALLLAGLPALAGSKKSVTGKIRSYQDGVVRIEKAGLVGESYVEIEVNDKTKVKGQLLPGLRAKVKYLEEDPGGGGVRRRVALEIETRPEYASKQAKKAAEQLSKPSPAKRD